jgi:hypothetical protein
MKKICTSTIASVLGLLLASGTALALPQSGNAGWSSPIDIVEYQGSVYELDEWVDPQDKGEPEEEPKWRSHSDVPDLPEGDGSDGGEEDQEYDPTRLPVDLFDDGPQLPTLPLFDDTSLGTYAGAPTALRSVPTPGSAVILGAGALTLMRRRRG